MPIVCIDRPNRTKVRTFSAKDVGRIACKAVEAGESPAEIVKQLEECLGKQLCDRERIRQELLDYLNSFEAFFDVLSILAGVVIGILVPMLKWGTKILKLGLNRVLKLLPKKVRNQLQDMTQKSINDIEKRGDEVLAEFKTLQDQLKTIIKDI